MDRNKIVKQAQSWIGLKESDGSHKKVIDIYNSQKELPRGYKVQYNNAWCATFVSAVAIKCGATDVIPCECSCMKMIDKFKSINCWKEDDSYTPQPGEIIFYDWNDSGKGDNTGWSDHVGIVEKVSNNKITVIEGNMNDKVGRRVLAVNSKNIRGYGLPKYEAGSVATKPAPAALKVGDKVRVKKGAKTITGNSLAAFVYNRDHIVKEVKGNRVVITFRGVVVAAIAIENLEKV